MKLAHTPVDHNSPNFQSTRTRPLASERRRTQTRVRRQYRQVGATCKRCGGPDSDETPVWKDGIHLMTSYCAN